MRAGIALGSNLGDRLANLHAAREQVNRLPGVEPPLLASAVYETDPVDCEPGAARFLNAVIEIGYAGEASELLRELRQIEESLGRPETHLKNISRTLDLDLLYFGDTETNSPDLHLPHPRMHERRFVLEPLAQIRADRVLPRQTESVASLLRGLPEMRPLVRVASEW